MRVKEVQLQLEGRLAGHGGSFHQLQSQLIVSIRNAHALKTSMFFPVYVSFGCCKHHVLEACEQLVILSDSVPYDCGSQPVYEVWAGQVKSTGAWICSYR